MFKKRGVLELSVFMENSYPIISSVQRIYGIEWSFDEFNGLCLYQSLQIWLE